MSDYSCVSPWSRWLCRFAEQVVNAACEAAVSKNGSVNTDAVNILRLAAHRRPQLLVSQQMKILQNISGADFHWAVCRLYFLSMPGLHVCYAARCILLWKLAFVIENEFICIIEALYNWKAIHWEVTPNPGFLSCLYRYILSHHCWQSYYCFWASYW